MDHIIHDLLLALQDLQSINNRSLQSALTEVNPDDLRVLASQVKRIYKILDIGSEIEYGNYVNGGYVAGMKYNKSVLKKVLVVGPGCHEWINKEDIKKATQKQ